MSRRILVVEDDGDLREALAGSLRRSGFEVVEAADGAAALVAARDPGIAVVVTDVQLPGPGGVELLARLRAGRPGLPVLLMTAFGTIAQAVESMRLGASDYLAKPFEAPVLVARVAMLADAAAGPGDDEAVARDPRSVELLALAGRVAASEVTVLLTGESGTGKEVLARHVHRRSQRAEGPFVALNCAAIPENMLEAVMFGYEKGAYTGAHQAHPGKFEQAARGTLLLDEISEMSLALQAKLLRVLQEREVERLGGRVTIPLDVRVIATSNRDLHREVSEGGFREDLYYRLSVFPLEVPPLRERRGDIGPLARHLLVRAAGQAGRPVPDLDPGALTRLETHAWPGNVRELDNVLQRALILHQDGVVREQDLHLEADRPPAVASVESSTPADDSLEGGLRTRERKLILDALHSEEGNRTAAAARLGISPRTLRYKLARLREAGVALGRAAGP